MWVEIIAATLFSSINVQTAQINQTFGEPHDCNLTYHGNLVQLWPDHSTIIPGILSDYPYNIGCFTFFNVNGIDYAIQHPNVTSALVNDTNCTFVIQYHADPIFRGNFEDVCA